MKKIICLFVGCCFIAFSSKAIGNNPEETDGTKISLWIPGIFVKYVGKMADKHTDVERIGDIIQKFGSITICIREGDKYDAKTDKKITRKLNRLDRREYENLITVREEETTVDIRIRENKKGVIKKMSIIVDEQNETFVYLKVNCKIKSEDILQLVQEDFTQIVN